MKKIETENCNLRFEEMEEIQEFSFGSVGVTAISVTTALIILCQFLF